MTRLGAEIDQRAAFFVPEAPQEAFPEFHADLRKPLLTSRSLNVIEGSCARERPRWNDTPTSTDSGADRSTAFRSRVEPPKTYRHASFGHIDPTWLGRLVDSSGRWGLTLDHR